jgi:hypothetical protein
MATPERPAVQDADDKAAADQAQAAHERRKPPIGQPGGFENDPPDASNPNEVIEHHRRKLRPNGG